MATTTFRKLRKAGACRGRYRRLAKALGGVRKYGEDNPIPLVRILEMNGIYDAIWALSAVEDRLARLFACRCVRETPLGDGRTVWDLLTDERSRRAVETAEAWCRGEATDEELAAAWASANAVAYAAASAAARACASASPNDAANDAAWDAGDAAWGAGWDITWSDVLAAQSGIFREMFGEEE